MLKRKYFSQLQEPGQFHLVLEYVKSEGNVSDKFTRTSSGLEASISLKYFQKICDNLGPFRWDLMVTSANVKKDLKGKPLCFFSR